MERNLYTNIMIDNIINKYIEFKDKNMVFPKPLFKFCIEYTKNKEVHGIKDKKNLSPFSHDKYSDTMMKMIVKEIKNKYSKKEFTRIYGHC
jgi:hypothetical protein